MYLCDHTQCDHTQEPTTPNAEPRTLNPEDSTQQPSAPQADLQPPNTDVLPPKMEAVAGGSNVGAGPVQRWQPYMGYDPLKRRGFGQTAVRNADVARPFVPGVPAKPAPPAPTQTRNAGGAPEGYDDLLTRRSLGQAAVRNTDAVRTLVPETPAPLGAQNDQTIAVVEKMRARKDREDEEAAAGRRRAYYEEYVTELAEKRSLEEEMRERKEREDEEAAAGRRRAYYEEYVAELDRKKVFQTAFTPADGAADVLARVRLLQDTVGDHLDVLACWWMMFLRVSG